MKTFQKIALVSAIAAAPFAAQADLTPMDDSLMGNTTGQAGVTIEIDLGDDGIKVGSVVYTDTAHDVSTLVTDTNGVDPGETGYVDTYADVSTDGGSVALENINVNLTGVLTQTIDVSENGDLEMTMSSPGALTVSMGNDAADTTGDFSALKLVGANSGALGNDSEIINNLDLAVNLGASTTTIKNLGTSASAGLGTLENAGVVGDYKDWTSSMAIQMNASVEVTDMNLGLFGYTKEQANILGQSHSSTLTAKGNLDASAAGTVTYDANGVASSDDATDAVLVGTYNGTLDAVKNTIATGSAIQVSGVTVSAAGGGAIDLNQVIWAVGGDASDPTSKAGVYIQLGAMDMDIGVDGIAIGGSSIGSLEINGLELAGMTQRIYGH